MNQRSLVSWIPTLPKHRVNPWGCRFCNRQRHPRWRRPTTDRSPSLDLLA